MTVSVDGVRIQKRPRSRGLLWSIIAIEAILSVIVYISFAAHFIWPETTRAAAGVSSMLSYEGRLTDTSGNPLGGTGTQYCFRFSIYDASSGGTKLWPAGTPSVTLATTTDGVFTALVGQADSLTYNFYDSDTVYLNVEAYSVAASGGTCTGGSYETLSPRQQIAATGYARSSANVYSSLLFTDNTNNRVQIGTGVGGGSPKFLGLDVKNTDDYIGQSCTTSGTVWYNSAISKALVCENGTIQAISNASATSTVAALTTNTGTPAASGTIVFSNSNGVTFGINGNTITASVAAGGGGITYSGYAPEFHGKEQVAGQQGQGTFFVQPMSSPDFQFDRFVMPINFSNTSNSSGSATVSFWVGIYTSNVSTLSLLMSTSASTNVTMSGTAGSYSLYAGPRNFTIPWTTTVSASNYWIGIGSRTTTGGANMSISQFLVSQPNSVYSGNFGVASNATKGGIMGQGFYSATTSAVPASIAFTQINASGSLNRRPPVYFFMSNTI